MLKYFNRRIIYIKERSDLLNLLLNSMPFLKEFTQEFQNEISRQTENQVGSLIMTIKTPENFKSEGGAQLDNELPLSFTAWVGKASIRPLINIHVRRFFLGLVNVDQALISKETFSMFFQLS
jgi:hypothetical protein